MATFSGNFNELLEPRLSHVYFKRYRQEDLLYPQVFNVQKSTRAFEDAIKIGTLGTLTQKGEGQPVAYDDPIQGQRKRTVHTTYALGFRVTMEMQMDDLYGIIEQMPKDLADATRNHQETIAWGKFNNGFTAADGLEGEKLFATDHVLLKNGGTYSNMLSPGVAVSVTGLEAMVTRARLMVDESNRFTPITLSTLVIHPNDEHEVHRLLESELEPGTNENQVNAVRSSRLGISPLSVPYLTDTDAWFLLAKKDQHSLIWYNRMEVTFSSNKDAQTKDALFDVMYRAHVTHDDFRGVFGSNP